MAEVTYRRIQITPYEGCFGVVLEWSDTCALTFTRDTLDEAFDSIRKEIADSREFTLLPSQG